MRNAPFRLMKVPIYMTTKHIVKPDNNRFLLILHNSAIVMYPLLKRIYNIVITDSAIYEPTAAPSAPKFGIKKRLKQKFIIAPSIIIFALFFL